MATEVRFEAATEEHLVQLAATMRPADVAECWAAAGYTPMEALRESVRVSDFTHVLLLDGQVAAVYGCARVQRAATALGDTGVALAWSLSSHVVDRHPRAFLWASRFALARMLERYVVLFNFVDARYAAAVRWCAHLGFAVGEPQPFGPEGLPFHPVILRRS